MNKTTDNSRHKSGHANSRSDTFWKAVLRLNVIQDLTHVAYFPNVSSISLLFLCTNYTLNIWNKNLNDQKYNLQSV